MKKAFQYIRKSNEEQSNFSISGQQMINEEWARKNKIEIVGTYIDDGYSAKDFNRPDWRRLEKDLPRSGADFLIVMKYDRLIRNVLEGLTFVEKLEQKWGITLLSVMENYSIDIYDPYFFKMRADMFVDAEFERRRISDRTRFGIWSGRTQGRYLGKAPYGYKNAKDSNDKPVILVQEESRSQIKGIFEDFLLDLPLATVKARAKEKGFNMAGKEAVKRILLNPVYAGLVEVKAYKDSNKKTVLGLHEAIVSTDTYWEAVYKLQTELRTIVHHQHDENFPLRGFIQCEECGNIMTGSKTKGRNGHYHYYMCNTHRKKSFSAPKADAWIQDILQTLSFKQEYVDAILVDIKQKMDQTASDREIRVHALNREIVELEEKMTSLEEKYIRNTISEAVYMKWHSGYTKDLAEKKREKNTLSQNVEELWKNYTTSLPYLKDLKFIYTKARIEDKKLLLRAIFPAGLSLTERGYRTAFLAPPFYVEDLSLQGLLDVKKEGESTFFDKLPVGVGSGASIEPLLRVIERIMQAA